MEGLDEEANGEPAPASDKVFCLLPEEDCYAASYDASNDTGEDEEAAECFRRRVDGLEDAEADYEGCTSESEGIEATDEVGRPVWGMAISERPCGLHRVVEILAYHLFLCPQKTEGRPVMMRRAPRTPNAGPMTVASSVSLNGELVAVGETEVMTSETTVVAVNIVLAGTLITLVPDRLVLIVDTGTEVVNVVVLVEFWAWTKSGNSPRTTLSMCGCRAAIVETTSEKKESRKGQWQSLRLEKHWPQRPKAVRDPNLTEQITGIVLREARRRSGAGFIKPQCSAHAHPIEKIDEE